MVQWATHIGAKVIACVSTKEKAEQAKADGAQHIVLYSDKNLVERVKEITNGAGVSVVYDSVGKDTFQVKFKPTHVQYTLENPKLMLCIQLVIFFSSYTRSH
jgi:NADPH2:quinone reductase